MTLNDNIHNTKNNYRNIKIGELYKGFVDFALRAFYVFTTLLIHNRHSTSRSMNTLQGQSISYIIPFTGRNDDELHSVSLIHSCQKMLSF